MKDAVKFLYFHIKPYKWWYFLILQAPILTGFYSVLNYYSFKLIVDEISSGANPAKISLAVAIFFSANIFLDISWRISNFAERKSEPFVRKNIILDVYNHVTRLDYSYFQNTQSGAIISKMKGILDGYDSVFSNLHSKTLCYFCWAIFPLFALFFVNYTIATFMLFWCLIFFAVMFPMVKKMSIFSGIEGDEKHKIFGSLADNVANIFAILNFAKQKQEHKKLENAIENGFVKAQIAMYKYDFKFQIVGIILYWPMVAFVFLFMLKCRKSGIISSGDFIFVLSTVITTISFNLWMFVTHLADFMKEMGDFRSSFSIMKAQRSTLDKKDAKILVI